MDGILVRERVGLGFKLERESMVVILVRERVGLGFK